jgi:hypothetical protein
MEAKRVSEANRLALFTIALCEAVVSRGGVHFIEHPEDPGEPPYPSIWATSEMLEFESRVRAKRALCDQCELGGETPKSTCISGTIDGLTNLDGLRCSHNYNHPRLAGVLINGKFATAFTTISVGSV